MGWVDDDRRLMFLSALLDRYNTSFLCFPRFESRLLLTLLNLFKPSKYLLISLQLTYIKNVKKAMLYKKGT